MTLDDSEAVVIEGAVAPCDILFVCEHASRSFPTEFGELGLTEEVRRSHVAWDPGALTLTRELAKRFDCTLVAGGVSRLLYDCNRPPEAQDAVPTKSEVFDIPGNMDLSETDRQARVSQIYQPFKEAVQQVIEVVHPKAIVTVHSFTPVYHGKQRAVEIGILHDRDTRLADKMLTAMADGPFNTRRNDPYGPEHGVTHSLRAYALPNKLPNVMLEVRNDLLAGNSKAVEVTDALEAAIALGMAELRESGEIA
ncbi:N-formylglutamate amidohydrolase [Shimia sagamensis]|uniref:Predicted N-formylglutamate amidohydrolase n=1 Tax=Shimia sagamensis TaxID=1566352 RepID=A0ABY1NNX8_9RHOB|nr:N-formylglutamate amidohydrolase [Shimia sagamensis]SMP14532.1 Predicted N-formylglutamate amidohydrolase [Shimia sagamensis]